MLVAKVVKLCLLAMVPTVSGAFWSTTVPEDQEDTPDASTSSSTDAGTPKTQDEPVEYGVDISFPMHHASLSTNYPWLEHNVNPNVPTPKKYKDMPIQPLGDRAQFYKEYLDSCRESFGSKGSRRCTSNELDRIAMTLRQPQSMQNYTELGFKSKLI
jgi:hypothetical protein